MVHHQPTPDSKSPPKAGLRVAAAVLLVALLFGVLALNTLTPSGDGGGANEGRDDAEIDSQVDDGDDGGQTTNGSRGDTSEDDRTNGTDEVNDGDRDGVADEHDACPSTPRNVDVDASGCRKPLDAGLWMHSRFGGKSAMFDGENMSTWNQTLASIEA